MLAAAAQCPTLAPRRPALAAAPCARVPALAPRGFSLLSAPLSTVLWAVERGLLGATLAGVAG
eukprot:CAMPEP_0115877966 /NCGR_PEP_ID=MMETSP0287-20121206/26512_1 /TAXON_ID=412157 /ORGANISM="Chrysochromulina rotalis, Strain UIO044" /LENGTH=62 /DNA_ID=CAMNT_0003333531 /DNA_START=317 /DNA_END=501 /DNA_ORIENTATION=+